MSATIQSQTTLIHADSGLTAASVTQRIASEDAFATSSIALTTTAESLIIPVDMVVPRQVLIKLLTGDNALISVDGGTLYPLSLSAPGDSMLLGLNSRTVSAITCVADVAGSLGGKYFSISDITGPVFVWMDTGTGEGVAATGTLTGHATTNVVAGATVTIGSKTYTYRLGFAANALTNNGTIPANGDTVTIDGKYYTFQTVLTNADGNVFLGSSAAAAMTNLSNAINATGGNPGTDYAEATVANTQVSSSNPSATAIVVTSLVAGNASNGIPTVKSAATLTWANSALSGADITNEGDVCIGTTADGSLLNLLEAINHTGTPDVGYKCAAAHPQVSADAFVTAHSFTFTARVVGVATSGYGTTESSATLAFSNVNMAGGINPSLAPVVTTQRLLPVIIASDSPGAVIADAVAAALNADDSFLCPNPAASTLAITDAVPGARSIIAVGTSGFTSPSAVFTAPASIFLKSLSTSQVVVAMAPA